MKRLALLPILALAFVATGCGGDDEASDTATVAPAAESCDKAQLNLVTTGKLTVGTDNPAFSPWFGGGTPEGSDWEFNDPSTGEGFESAVAYAVADQLGFAQGDVTWVVVPTWAPSLYCLRSAIVVAPAIGVPFSPTSAWFTS